MNEEENKKLTREVGLLVWGISIDKNHHWIVGQVAFFLCKQTLLLLLSLPHYLLTCTVAAGIQVGNTVTSSYIVDSYPLQSTSVVTFYAVFLNFSAFINPVCFLWGVFWRKEKLTRTIVLYFLLASLVRLDLDVYRTGTHCRRGWNIGICPVAGIRGVDAGISAVAVVGESGV